jgi:hypothetical protein
MPNRSSKEKDPNVTAFNTVQEFLAKNEPKPAKNPAAVALGRLGGLKGGKARAAALSKKQRIEIAKKAAAKRWQAD